MVDRTAFPRIKRSIHPDALRFRDFESHFVDFSPSAELLEEHFPELEFDPIRDKLFRLRMTRSY